MVFFHPPVIPIAIAIMGMAADIDVGARNTNYHLSLSRRECGNAHCAKCDARGQKRSHQQNPSDHIYP
jgi:hypothetical protein